MKECVLCFEQIQYIGIGQCNHKDMCFKCQYKMRMFTKNNHCPLCNSINMEIIITDDFQLDFQGYSIEHLQEFDKKAGIYSLNSEIFEELKKLVELKCFAPGCKEEGTVFQSINMLKKHLKEKHQRFLCDICLEHKTCILSEQKLYTQPGLEKHTKKGDFDEDGNVYFFHPYCNFCLKNFYDEEAIMRHMPDHFTCFVCGPEHKYIYYKSYQTLEKHFKLSHYLCDDKQCLEKSFIVFKTATELDIHNTKSHFGGARKHTVNQVNLQTMTGFSFGDNDEPKIRTKDDFIKDKEGVDFEGQFLTLRKTKMKNTQVDSHSDEPIDYRDFYCQKYDEKYIREETDMLQLYYNEHYNEEQPQQQQTNGRNNNRNKKEQPKRKLSSKIEDIFQEDIPLLRYHQIHNINDDLLMKKLGLVLDQQKFEILEEAQHLMTKKKQTPKNYFDIFSGLVGKLIALRLFPVIAASLNSKYELIQKEMDDVYIEEIKKLPSRNKNFINSSLTYKEFFSIFKNYIEDHLSERIISSKLKLNLKDLRMERSRRFQLIEILRRVKTKEMAKLKFISNFGVSVEVSSLILRKIFFADQSRIHELLGSIPNHEFLHLFVYVNYCNDLLQGKDIYQEKQSISVNMLKDFFQSHPDIYKQYYPKDQEVDEEYTENENQPIIGVIKKSTVIQKGNNHSTKNDIDTQDIYQFPSMNPSNNKKGTSNTQPSNTTSKPVSKAAEEDPILPVSKQPPPKQQQHPQPQVQSHSINKVEVMSNWAQANENPFLYESQDQKIRANQALKEEFPTLGGGKLTPFTIPKKKQQPWQEEERPQTGKPNSTQPLQSSQWGGPGSEKIDKYDINTLKVVSKKKGKNGQVQISLAGGFK